MHRNLDLDAVDRATLTAWKWSNLIGWGAAGLAVTLALVAGTNVIAGHIRSTWEAHAGPGRGGGVGVGWLNQATLVMVFVASAAGGTLTGSRVFRAPHMVAFVSQEMWFLVWAIWQLTQSSTPPQGSLLAWFGFELLFSLLFALPAAIASGIAWNRRPEAMRGRPGLASPS